MCGAKVRAPIKTLVFKKLQKFRGIKMEKKNKVASAIAGAIMAYLRMEEEARAKM